MDNDKKFQARIHCMHFSFLSLLLAAVCSFDCLVFEVKWIGGIWWSLDIGTIICIFREQWYVLKYLIMNVFVHLQSRSLTFTLNNHIETSISLTHSDKKMKTGIKTIIRQSPRVL